MEWAMQYKNWADPILTLKLGAKSWIRGHQKSDFEIWAKKKLWPSFGGKIPQWMTLSLKLCLGHKMASKGEMTLNILSGQTSKF